MFCVFSLLVAEHRRRGASRTRTRSLEILQLYYLSVMTDINKPRLLIPNSIDRQHIRINQYNDQSAEALFGFSVADLRRLCDGLHVPEHFQLNRNRHTHNVNGEHAFLYFLYRMHSPCARMTLDSDRFGFDYSTLSKMFNVVLRFIHNNYKYLYRVLPYAHPRFETFNNAICAAVLRDHPDLHDVPADARYCALFADGTRFRVSRPEGPYWVQKAVYSGHKNFHNFGAQGIMGPDGIFYDVYHGPVGRYNDKRFMRDSKVNARMAALQQGEAVQYIIYTDKGYYNASHIICAAHGPGAVTAEQSRVNKIMSMERVGVEWAFGKVKSRVPYLTQPRLLKLQAVDVGMRVSVAFLLTNFHTCLHGSQSSTYFNCMPPTLEEYINFV